MTALAFLLLCFYTAVVSGEDSTDLIVTAEPGDVVILPCYEADNVSATVTSWVKNGVGIASGGPSAPVSGAPSSSSSSSSSSQQDSRLQVLPNGSLNILKVVSGDEGTYLCASTLLGNNTFHARVLFQVASGPNNVSISIDPGDVLPNGTHTFIRGSSAFVICSGVSYPSPELVLSFTGPMYSNMSLVNITGKSLMEYRIDNIQPSAQGIYSCNAHNQVSHQRVNKSAELLVYYASDRHPECMWTQDSTFVVFHCSWFGAYPAPTLTWTGPNNHILASNVTDSLVVRINSSLLFEGQILRCSAQHQALHKEDVKSCTFTLKTPYPVGDPLVTALDGTNVTLKCREITSTPPAITTWRKGLKQDLITNGSKYVVTEDGALFQLTIVNITKDDEGVYFCCSENPLGATELEIYLTVKTSSAYTGGVIGLFIAVLIVGSAVIIAKTVYSSRHRICLGGFGRMEDDGGDVLSLVESDDEQIVFQDTVPRLPPVSNGCQTTLVEIHRIPSTDHEEAETVDAHPQQQDNPDKTEEPEDLVTF